ncbi:unnamed protein product [Heligmosomoides polygyrus]|uniref:Riboflavin transporter n=1 Tax=Heligmosomoides polygyrus TaxID=6339 RepID=A0A183GJI8_HELPZ|nr:unnamed protein product [Heligmosomoides polygyrus]
MGRIACIGPLIYAVIHKGCKSVEIPHTGLILALLILACACQLGLVFFWSDTVAIGSKRYSLALYLLLFGLAVVDAISNVLFIPFMAGFHPTYLNAFFVGMGFSSLIPSILSLIQGSGSYTCEGSVPHYSPPLFSAAIFFLIIFFSTCISTVAFVVLYYVAVQKNSPVHRRTCFQSAEEYKPLSTTSYVFILLTVSLVNAQMNGILPSVSSFSALPYSQATYHYSIALSNIMMPLASFLSFFVLVRKLPLLGMLSGISTATTAFLVYLAALSPAMIFNSKSTGSALSISASLLAAGLHSYLRVAFASRLRVSDESESRLFWNGVFTQIGSFTGSMVMLVVNLNGVFKSAPPCR